MPAPISAKVPPVGRLLKVKPLPLLVVTWLKLPNIARSIVWLVAPVNVRFSKLVTMPANVLSADEIAALVAVIVKVSVPMPPDMAAVGVSVIDGMVSESSPAPKEIALVDVAALFVILSTPAPPVKLALEASMVTIDVPVVAVVSREVTVAAERSAVMPAEPATVTVLRALNPAVELSFRTLVPPKFNAVTAPNVQFDKVELTPVVVMFKVV